MSKLINFRFKFHCNVVEQAPIKQQKSNEIKMINSGRIYEYCTVFAHVLHATIE